MTPDEAHSFWQQNADYANELVRAINEQVHEQSPTSRALGPFTSRINCGLESIRVLHHHAQHSFRPDGMTILRAMYDAHLQALYILADPANSDDKAQLFLDFRWIEQRVMQERLTHNPTRLAKTLLQSPKRAPGEEIREANYKRLRPKFLTNNGKKTRSNWYPGNLRDLAKAVGLEHEYEILQRILSGAVHSTPTDLLAGGTFAAHEDLLVVGWRLTFRVLGRTALHHAVPMSDELAEIVKNAGESLFD